MQCPQCRRGLTTITHRGVEFETCKTCHGLWFDRHEVAQYLHRSAQDGERPPVPHKETTPQWPAAEDAGFCPCCNQLLEFLQRTGSVPISGAP